MRARVSSSQRRSLADSWRIASCLPGHVTDVGAVDDSGLQWLSVPKASTVAACLRDIGAWSLDGPATRFDATDWWFRKQFPRNGFTGNAVLGFEGLATVCDVWLNGQPLLRSASMFLEHEIAAANLQDENELILRFHALDQLLVQRRARPRWRAPMIENQQLRWFRTTVLGRTPGWSPPAAPVGIWRDIWIEERGLHLKAENLAARIHGEDGVVDVTIEMSGADAASVARAEVSIERDTVKISAELSRVAASDRWSTSCPVPKPARWWPHTHGEPALYAVRVRLLTRENETVEADLGHVGFRTLEIERSNGAFELKVNGVPIFCRGACWTPLDTAALHGTPEAYNSAFERITDAGMNMIRLGGTMVYESESFLDACDAHGVLLWQEFMFANMDYPSGDREFSELVRVEASQQLRRLQGRPSLAVLCGNSEIEQQASMWGAPRELWSPELFHSTLAEITHELCPATVYWPSSAHGGDFPHQPSMGTSSYYGVGAYLRPLADARESQVRFASECLAFANVPEDSAIATMPGGLSLKSHHSQWKARTPRDLGAGWDFEDVRDHYLERLFAVDARSLRYADHDRYMELSRIVPGELMAATFAQWRSSRGACKGALVWFLRDLWMGAGWGVLDANMEPKPAFYYLRRALQPIGLSLSDEGCNGLTAHLQNDTSESLNATLRITLYQRGEIPVGSANSPVEIAPVSGLEVSLGSLFASFVDLSYAYRFGPAAHDVIVATLTSSNSTELATATFLPLGRHRVRDSALGLIATGRLSQDHAIVTVASTRYAQAVAIRVDGWRCEDNYFDLAPGQERAIRLVPNSPTRGTRGIVTALNAVAPLSLVLSRSDA